MSAKWRNNLAWDDRFFPAWAWPAKFLLRAFSSIALAVVLLSLVAVYGILASTPIGLLALIPTVLVYAATIVAAVLIGAALPTWALWGVLGGRASRSVRFVACFVALCGLTAASFWAWQTFAWPHLRYSETTGTGLRFFAAFVNEHKGITVRRLPGMEMSELEFYAWWPLELILLLFVLNMMTATVRRIDFTIPKAGVIMVHSGIITIALGSIYYSALKQEGDVLLLAGPPDASGKPTPGRVENGFFDNTQPVLWLNQGRGLEQRALRGLPRYNDYNLSVLGKGVGEAGAAGAMSDGGRTLDVPVPKGMGLVDADLSFRVVGYASYATLVPRWRPVDDGGAPAAVAGETKAEENPIRIVELHSTVASDGTAAPTAKPRVDEIPFLPLSPADRLAMLGNFVGIEYTRGMDEGRWEALRAPLDSAARHALLVEVPGKKFRQVVPIEEGTTFDAGGFAVQVQSIAAVPPFPIITKGYEGANSSVVVVRVTPPELLGGERAAFDRFLYHRFPEISQDLLANEKNDRGMPTRRNADKSIILTYIDASMVQVYLDEVVPEGDATSPGVEPAVRAIVRVPGSEPRVIDRLATGESIPFGPMVSLKLGPRWARAERVETPVVVPEAERERDAIGTHKQALIALEVSALDPTRPSSAPAWTKTVWVPFTQYVGVGPDSSKAIEIPGLPPANKGAVPAASAAEDAPPATRTVSVAFGRRWHAFPNLALQLTEFEMFPYPHSSQPRDFRSDVLVFRGRTIDEAQMESRYTSLNDPLLVHVPFEWGRERPALANAVGWLVSWVAPMQYKFSQAGWDQRGWNESKAAAERGEAARATANFTILGVGNNPGIYIIAAGALMMSVGIPYAFYIKPIILRRRKEAIQRALARGEYVKPGGAKEGLADDATATNGMPGPVPRVVNGRAKGHASSGGGEPRRFGGGS